MRRNTIYRIRKTLAMGIAIGLAFLIPGKASAITIDGLAYFVGTTTEYRYIANVTSAFDVRGKINGSNTYNFQTTYKNGGYTIDFEVDGTNYSVQRISNGTTITNKGVRLTLVAETTTNGLDVHLNITNPEGNGDHTYRVAMTADVQLGSNDYAAIYKKDHTGMVITQDDSSKTSDYGAKVYIDFKPSVNTSWLGNYKDRASNKYTDGTVSAYTVADAVDTASAWSWNNTIQNGESTTLTTSFMLTETNTTTVSFYNLNQELVEEKEALVGGALVLPNLSTPEEGYLHLWCEDSTDLTTCYEGGASIIVEKDDLALYESYIRDPGYIQTSKVSFYNQDDKLVDEKEAPVGEEVVLPNLSTPEEGYLHLWCEDSTDLTTCYEGGISITLGEDDLILQESYFEDPNYIKPSTISFYDQNDELVEEREVPVGEETTLPELSAPEEGYLHLWCENAEDLTTCHEGNTIIIVEEDLSLHEAYLNDPNYIPPEDPVEPDPVDPVEPEDPVDPTEPVDPVEPEDPTPTEDPVDPIDDPTDPAPTDETNTDEPANTPTPDTDNNTIAYEIQSITYSNNAGMISIATTPEPTTADNNTDAEEIIVPIIGTSNDKKDTMISDTLEKTDPLGVTNKTDGNGIWDILKFVLPCLALALLIFFFIILLKRKKDEDEEEEASTTSKN